MFQGIVKVVEAIGRLAGREVCRGGLVSDGRAALSLFQKMFSAKMNPLGAVRQ